MEIRFNAIYPMNISAQSAMAREIISANADFFVAFASYHKY